MCRDLSRVTEEPRGGTKRQNQDLNAGLSESAFNL